MGTFKFNQIMKFATVALIATASARDAFGCHGSDWGNEVEERAESDCIYGVIGHHGGKDLTKVEIKGALFQYC